MVLLNLSSTAMAMRLQLVQPYMATGGGMPDSSAVPRNTPAAVPATSMESVSKAGDSGSIETKAAFGP